MAEFRYRGREIHQEDILYIRALIERIHSGKAILSRAPAR
jgi:hypothetical protein